MLQMQLLHTCAVPLDAQSEIIKGMCTKRISLLASILSFALFASACGGSERTGSSFCAQLGKEIPAIAQQPQTADEVKAMVDRYERLLNKAPLSIEKDFVVLTDVLRLAEKLDASKPEKVQELADASYAANQSALSVRDWVMSTCAVDISTGLNIEPPRQPTTTTVAPATTVAPPTTVGQ